MLKGDGRDFFFFFLNLMLKRDGRGVEVNVFFCFHLTCGRRKGKGYFFFFLIV